MEASESSRLEGSNFNNGWMVRARPIAGPWHTPPLHPGTAASLQHFRGTAPPSTSRHCSTTPCHHCRTKPCHHCGTTPCHHPPTHPGCRCSVKAVPLAERARGDEPIENGPSREAEYSASRPFTCSGGCAVHGSGLQQGGSAQVAQPHWTSIDKAPSLSSCEEVQLEGGPNRHSSSTGMLERASAGTNRQQTNRNVSN